MSRVGQILQQANLVAEESNLTMHTDSVLLAMACAKLAYRLDRMEAHQVGQLEGLGTKTTKRQGGASRKSAEK